MTVHYWITKHTDEYNGSLLGYQETRDFFAHGREGAEMMVQQIVDETIAADSALAVYNWTDTEVTLKRGGMGAVNKLVRITISPAYTSEELVEAGLIEETTLDRSVWGDIFQFEESPQ